MSLSHNVVLLPIVNSLVIWGEILIGAALVLGILIRFASFWGALMMVFYYIVSLPPASGWITQQTIYGLVFISLMFSGIGYFLGLDTLLRRIEERRHPLRLLLG